MHASHRGNASHWGSFFFSAAMSVASIAAAAPLISVTNQPASNYIVQSHDAAFSPPGTSAEKSGPITSLPFVREVVTTDGTSQNDGHFNLSDSLLSFRFDQTRNGFPNSFNVSVGVLSFIPTYNLHYDLSGTYEADVRTYQMQQNVQLSDDSAPITLFDGTNQNNTRPADTVLSLGSMAGEVHGTIGSLTGSLFAGQTYHMQYNYQMSSAGSDDPGATATAILNLRLSIRGDLNGDRAVGFDDLLTLAQHYGTTNATYQTGDVDGDGKVGFEDLLILAQNYGVSSPTANVATAVPETSIFLFTIITLVGSRSKGRTFTQSPTAPIASL